jgi:arylsulfatase A-like enzyme
MKPSADIRTAATYGLVAWSSFAVAELATCALVPVVAGEYSSVVPTYWRFSAILLLMYVSAGALSGAGTALLLRKLSLRSSPGLLLAGSTLCLTGFYLANLLIGQHRWDLGYYAVAFAASVIAILAAVAAVAPLRFRWAGIVTDPWLVASLLVGLPWLVQFPSFRHCVVLLVSVLLVGFISRRYLSPQAHSGRPVRLLAATATALAGVFLTTLLFTDGLPSLRPATKPALTSKGPNIVMIVLDTVRADHMSLYGYPRDTTPNLRMFAEGATLYRKAVATSSWTLPSHASMFTGLYPRAHGASNYPEHGQKTAMFHPLAPKHRTLAELLSEEGYLTVAVVANTGFLRPHYGFDQGFQLFDARVVLPCQPTLSNYYPRLLMRRIMDRFLWTLEFDRVMRRADAVTDDAIRLLEEGSRLAQPLFLFLNYMDAHSPYVPPAPFDTMYPGKNRKMTRAHFRVMFREVFSGMRPISEEEHQHSVSQYDGAIRYLDSQIARVIHRLKELRLYDNSIIIVTSDHGEAFGVRNLVGHSQSLYQDQVYVPLVIKYAGQQKAETSGSLASHVDLLPTLAAATDLSVPPGLQGTDLRNISHAKDRELFAEAYIQREMAALRPQYPRRQFAVFRDNLKLIASSNGKSELYDLRKDPQERSDLSAIYGAATQHLRRRLDDWLSRVPMARTTITQTDQKAVEQLKSLGYVQ